MPTTHQSETVNRPKEQISRRVRLRRIGQPRRRTPKPRRKLRRKLSRSSGPVPLVIFAAFIGDWLLPHNLFDLVINLKTAKARGLDVPSSIGPRADEVTE